MAILSRRRHPATGAQNGRAPDKPSGLHMPQSLSATGRRNGATRTSRMIRMVSQYGGRCLDSWQFCLATSQFAVYAAAGGEARGHI
jgi:hypothetical protein